MLAYTTIGTNDLPRAAGFYDEVLGVLGAKRFMENEQFIAWGSSPDGVVLAWQGQRLQIPTR